MQVSNKFKALGLCLIALAMSVAAVMSASAETGGHFVSEKEHTILKGSQEASPNHLTFHDTIGSISCTTSDFSGTTSGNVTQTEIRLNPTYHGCKSGEKIVTVDMNGCWFTFTVNKNPSTTHNTVHLNCPVNQSVTITVWAGSTESTLACVEHLAPQTPKGGATYTTTGSGTTHGITADVTVSGIKVTRTAQFFGGCAFAPEVGESAELTGKATINGFDTENKQVGITAT
jgi:hypothetical protein